MPENISDFQISKDISIKQAMRQMRKAGEKILFVIDGGGKLIGALSDGDVRKWILSEGNLGQPVEQAANHEPKYVDLNYEIPEIKRMMLDLKIECIPVLDKDRRITEILTWEEVFAGKVPKHKDKLNMPVVIMAGGKGSRLDPFTRILPKPLIPIGNQPIIEIIMDKFNEHSINEFYISVNHKSKMIKSYFEEMNGKYDVKYIEEDKPLGTAGSLRLLKGKLNDPFLVTNCDVIVESDLAEIVRFHQDNQHDLTLIVSCKHYVIPYGVCEIENGGKLKKIVEKPEHDLLVNTGMYVLNNKILDLIPDNEFFNFTDLIEVARSGNYKVGVFPINEKSWIDIGQWEEYHKAIDKMKVEQ